MNDEQKSQYETEGYVIVDDAVDPAMLEPLLAAAKRVKAKARSGEVDLFTHRTPNGEVMMVRGLFAPEFNEPIFADYLLSDPVMRYVEPVLGSEIRMGDVLLFSSPNEVDHTGGWHRDFGKNLRDGSPEVEMEILNRPKNGLKWHLALVDDSRLQLVPGSHARYRTDEERECLVNGSKADISAQKVIHLKAGQTIFWDGNTVHRGIYHVEPERMTLAANWRKHTEGEEPAETDERVKWLLADSVRDFLPKKMHIHYDRWRALQLG